MEEKKKTVSEREVLEIQNENLEIGKEEENLGIGYEIVIGSEEAELI